MAQEQNINLSVSQKERNVTATSSATRDDDFVTFDSSSGPITFTLVSALQVPGLKIFLKADNAGATGNAVTVLPAPGESIDTLSSIVLDDDHDIASLKSDGADWRVINTSAPSAIGSRTVVVFGASSVTPSTTTRYLAPWSIGTTAETNGDDNGRITAVRSATLRNLYVRHGTVGVSPNLITYTVRVNGTPTALAASLAANTRGPASDLIDTVSLVAGDEVDIEVTKSMVIALSPGNITVAIEVA